MSNNPNNATAMIATPPIVTATITERATPSTCLPDMQRTLHACQLGANQGPP